MSLVLSWRNSVKFSSPPEASAYHPSARACGVGCMGCGVLRSFVHSRDKEGRDRRVRRSSRPGRCGITGAMMRHFLLCFLPFAAAFAPTFTATAPAVQRRAGIITAKAPEFIFEVSPDREKIKFGCRQKTMTMVRPEEGSLREFIGSSSDRIVMSSWDPGKIVDNGDGEYTIAVEEVRHESLNRADAAFLSSCSHSCVASRPSHVSSSTLWHYDLRWSSVCAARSTSALRRHRSSRLASV